MKKLFLFAITLCLLACTPKLGIQPDQVLIDAMTLEEKVQYCYENSIS